MKGKFSITAKKVRIGCCILYLWENIFTDAFFYEESLTRSRNFLKKVEIPVGAVIVIDNRVIKKHNLTELFHDVTAHARRKP